MIPTPPSFCSTCIKSPPPNGPPPGLPVTPLAKFPTDATRDGFGPHKPPRTSRSNRANAPSSSSHAARHRSSDSSAEMSLALDHRQSFAESFAESSFTEIAICSV